MASLTITRLDLAQGLGTSQTTAQFSIPGSRGRKGDKGDTGEQGVAGPNLITDATSLGTLTNIADPAFLLVGNAAGTFARKLTHPSPSPAGSFTLASVTIDAFGRVTAASNGTVSAATISDSTATGRSLLTAADAATARSAIGAGTGNALTSGTLGQFAATTSAELAGVLTDETGFSVGAVVVFSVSPTMTGTTALRQTSGQTTNLLQLENNAGTIRGGFSPGAVLTGHDSNFLFIRPGNRQYRIGASDAGGQFLFGREDSTNGFMVNPDSGRVNLSAVTGNLSVTGGASGTLFLGGNYSGGTSTVEVGRRPADSSSGVGGHLRLWTNTGQSVPALSILAPGGGSTVASVSAGGSITLAGLTTLGTYTVATLPSASANAGAFAQVTDSNSTTNGNTVAGGGANRVPVFSNGTNWIIK